MSSGSGKPALVLPQQRRRYAEALRHFAAGRMTNLEYEDACDAIWDDGNDEAMRDIFAAAWHLYDDIRTHRLAGERELNRKERRVVARWVLFLRSQAPLAHLPLKKTRQRLECAMLIACLTACLAMPVAHAAGWRMLQFAAGGTLCLLFLRKLLCGGVSLSPMVMHAAFATGSDSVWPFASKFDLNTARRTPCYLHGGLTSPVSPDCVGESA